MPTFYPVWVTLALFIALILFDIIQRRKSSVAPHVFAGLVTLFLMLYLSFKDMELVSWGLLLIPLVVLIISFFLANTGTSTGVLAPPAAAPVSPVSCGTPAPTIATPAAFSTANQIISENNLCNLNS